MTDENKVVEVKQECFCKSKDFKKFLIVAGGTFVGGFCALSLFAALHKPPMPPCHFGPRMMTRPPMHCHHHMKRHGDFHAKHHMNHHKAGKKCCDHHQRMIPEGASIDKTKVEVKK